MSDTPMPWEIPGAPHPQDYRSKTVSHKRSDDAETLSLARELNEAVIAYRDEMENSSPYDAPYTEIGKMADAAEKLTGHLLEVINNQ